MPIAHRASAVGGTNPTTTTTITIPAATATDDVIFLAFTSRDHLAGTGQPTVTDNDTGGNAWASVTNSTDRKAQLWWKRATSATASKTVTIAGAVGSLSAVLSVFSGASKATVPWANLTLETNASGDESHASITPTRPDAMTVLHVFNYANDNASSSQSQATGGAMTERGDHLSTGGSDCATSTATLAQTGGPTATGAITWAQTNGATYSIVYSIHPLVANLTAAAGAFTLGGQAATLKTARKLTSAAGGFTLSGQAAALSYVKSLATAAGAFALTGQEAGLRVTRRLTLATGTLSLAGQATTLRRALSLTLDPASVSFTGQAAGLYAGRRLTASPGAVALTGQTLTMGRAYHLALELGAFTQTGQTAGLHITRTLSLGPTAFILAGQDITLTRTTAEPEAPATPTDTGGGGPPKRWRDESPPWSIAQDDADVMEICRQFLSTL